MPENGQIPPLTGFTRGLVASVFAVPFLVTHDVLRETLPIAAAPLVLLTTWRQRNRAWIKLDNRPAAR